MEINNESLHKFECYCLYDASKKEHLGYSRAVSSFSKFISKLFGFGKSSSTQSCESSSELQEQISIHCWICAEISKKGNFSSKEEFPRYCNDHPLNNNPVNSFEMVPCKEAISTCYYKYIGYKVLKLKQKESRFYSECLLDDIIKHILGFIR